MGYLIINYRLFPLEGEKKKIHLKKVCFLKNPPGHYLQVILAARGKTSFL